MTAPADHTIDIREAVVTHLLAASAVTAIVSSRGYGQRVPANVEWPYFHVGVLVTDPYEAQGQAGSDAEFAIHAYARGPDDAPCGALSKAIVAAMSDDALPFDSLGLVSMDWLGTQIMGDDGESADYHGIIRFRIVTTV